MMKVQKVVNASLWAGCNVMMFRSLCITLVAQEKQFCKTDSVYADVQWLMFYPHNAIH